VIDGIGKIVIGPPLFRAPWRRAHRAIVAFVAFIATRFGRMTQRLAQAAARTMRACLAWRVSLP